MPRTNRIHKKCRRYGMHRAAIHKQLIFSFGDDTSKVYALHLGLGSVNRQNVLLERRYCIHHIFVVFGEVGRDAFDISNPRKGLIQGLE